MRSFERRFISILGLMNIVGGVSNETFTRAIESIFAFICALNQGTKRVTLAPKGAESYDWKYETSSGRIAYCQLKTGVTPKKRYTCALGKLMLLDSMSNAENYVYSTDVDSVYISDAAVDCKKAVANCKDIKQLKKYCYGLAKILGVEDLLKNEDLSSLELLELLEKALRYKNPYNKIDKYFEESCKKLERV